MYVTCILFLMLWLGYAWVWKGVTLKDETFIEVKAPIFKQTCSTKEVACIDDCSFLCVEKNVKCVGGTCEAVKELLDIECSEKTGGVKMLVKEPIPHWVCICSDSRFYSGDACDALNPDVCEHGTFFYLGRERYVCICPPPYELIRIDLKPHCVAKEFIGFYDEATMTQSIF